MDPRRSGVRFHVHHVDPGRNERRKNQPVSFLGGVAKAAAAGVPAGVVQLVPQVGHRQPVDHLTRQSTALARQKRAATPLLARAHQRRAEAAASRRRQGQRGQGVYLTVRGRAGLHVHRGQVVGLQGAGVAVDAGQVDDLLPRPWTTSKCELGLLLAASHASSHLGAAAPPDTGATWLRPQPESGLRQPLADHVDPRDNWLTEGSNLEQVSPFMASTGLGYPGPHPEQLAEKKVKKVKDHSREVAADVYLLAVLQTTMNLGKVGQETGSPSSFLHGQMPLGKLLWECFCWRRCGTAPFTRSADHPELPGSTTRTHHLTGHQR